MEQPVEMDMLLWLVVTLKLPLVVAVVMEVKEAMDIFTIQVVVMARVTLMCIPAEAVVMAHKVKVVQNRQAVVLVQMAELQPVEVEPFIEVPPLVEVAATASVSSHISNNQNRKG